MNQISTQVVSKYIDRARQLAEDDPTHASRSRSLRTSRRFSLTRPRESPRNRPRPSSLLTHRIPALSPSLNGPTMLPTDARKVPWAVVLQITEVEAYRLGDSACHGRFGVTARTAPVFGPGGHAYVYLCYGLHTMLNVVADREGVVAAVLIRSRAPVEGLDMIQKRRRQLTDQPVLLSGPGKVGQALGISTEWSNHPLYTPGGLEILAGLNPESILVGARVGIEYALLEHVNARVLG